MRVCVMWKAAEKDLRVCFLSILHVCVEFGYMWFLVTCHF